MADVQATVKIVGDADDAVKSLKKVSDSVKDLDKQVSSKKNLFKEFLGGVGGLAGAVAGGQALAYAAQKAGESMLRLGKDTIQAASDLQALERRASVLFGDALPGVRSEVERLGAEIGRSSSDLLDYAAGFDAIAEGMNLPEQAAADMSVRLTRLTADFGSFFNVADDEAFSMIQGGLLGMGRSLQRYGIILNDTTLAEYARAKGLRQGIDEMNEAQIMALRYNFLLDKTTEIQGDATVNAHSFANEMKNLSAEWKDFQEAAGTPLLEGLAKALGVVTDAVGGLRMAVGGLSAGLKDLIATTGAGPSLKAGFGAGLGLTPLSLLKGGFGALFPGAKPNVLDLNNPGLSIALETPEQTAARKQKELQEEINSYAGLGSAGGAKGGKSAKDTMEELVRQQEKIAQAFAEQARVTKDVVSSRREELKLRERLGVLTKDETRELDSINRRIAFKKDLVDEATRAWEEQAEAVKRTEERVKDLTGRIADQQRELSRTLSDINTDFNRQRTETVADLVNEKADLDFRFKHALGLSEEQQARYGELGGILGRLSPGELASGRSEAALDPVQKLEQERQRRIQDATAKAGERLKELQDELSAEQQKLQAVKDAEFQKHQAVVSALSDRAGAVKQALDAELEAVRSNVSAQVAEFNRLRSPGSVAPKGVPAFGDGGIVTRPTLALIGEKGPEAVVPLRKGSSGIGGITIGAIHVHNEADEDRLIAKLTRLIQLQSLSSS